MSCQYSTMAASRRSALLTLRLLAAVFVSFMMALETSAARMPMIATTISSSIRVKPERRRGSFME